MIELFRPQPYLFPPKERAPPGATGLRNRRNRQSARGTSYFPRSRNSFRLQNQSLGPSAATCYTRQIPRAAVAVTSARIAVTSREPAHGTCNQVIDSKIGPGFDYRHPLAQISAQIPTYLGRSPAHTSVYSEMMSAPGTESIRVAIIEDQREIREGLSDLIDGSPGFHSTGVFSSMEDALAGIGRPVPHIALVDINTPVRSWRRTRARSKWCKYRPARGF